MAEYARPEIHPKFKRAARDRKKTKIPSTEKERFWKTLEKAWLKQ